MSDTDKRLTVGDVLSGGEKGFDPLNIDTTEIKYLSNAMPKDGNIDVNNAEVLATKYLRGADMCAELLAVATAYVQKADTQKKKAYSEAALVKSKDAGIKTDKSRAWFADMDDDYIKACNRHSEALAFVKWIGSKYDSFVKMHYLCRNIVKRGMEGEAAAGWGGTTPYEKSDVKETDTW
jgi:hypothetical protein